MILFHICAILLLAALGRGWSAATGAGASELPGGLRKITDLVIYEHPQFYSAFPSVVRRASGELLVAFRRAPERRAWGETAASHTDPNSYLVLVRSRDRGRTWTTNPELIYAHPFGGSQDPCLVQLRNGEILCSSYAWAQLAPDAIAKLKRPISQAGNFVFLGGYWLRSRNGGRSWLGPLIPPACPEEPTLDIFGQRIAAYNRGAMCEGKDGRLFWAVAATDRDQPDRTGTHLLISRDQGDTWQYSCPIARDAQASFNETSVYETPAGALVAFMRTENFGDRTCIARSTDGGRSFTWEDAGFQGHPHHALRLPDRRVLLVYGYRHRPFGIRARLLNAECTDAHQTREYVLRDDGGNGDLGYPWATLLSRNRALVVYYFNRENSTRHIAGSVVEF